MITVYIYNTNTLQENTYVLIDSDSGKTAVIDPGCYPKEMKVCLSGKSLEYILLTHAHGDHIAALNELKADFPDAVLIASSDEKELLNDELQNGSMQSAPKPVSAEADRYVNDHDHVSLGDTDIEFIMTPGHTKGGMSIYTDGKLFSGDTLFAGSVGRTDLEGGDWKQLKKSLRVLMALPEETVVYPGHGPETSILREKKGNPFV